MCSLCPMAVCENQAEEYGSWQAEGLSVVRLNVGLPRDSEGGGGTFGYGKAILYNCSRAQSILVHTRREGGGVRLRKSVYRDRPRCESRRIRPRTRALSGGASWKAKIMLNRCEEQRQMHSPTRSDSGLQRRRDGNRRLRSLEATSTSVVERNKACGLFARAISWHLWPKLRSPARCRLQSGSTVARSRLLSPDTNPVLARFCVCLRRAPRECKPSPATAEN